MSLVVDTHREYLSDRVRLDAFRRAVDEVVRPGDVVLDLGSGTSILGLFACAAGAARVHSVDSSGIIEVARAIAAANGFSDRIAFHNVHSVELNLPERVNVIVSDLIGRFGIDGGLVEDVADARDRWLVPHGRIIPSSVTLDVAPVEHPEGAANIDFWAARPAGFDMTPAREWAANTGYPTHFSPAALLGSPEAAAHLEMTTVTPAAFAIDVTLTVSRAGTLHGIGGWFHAQLSPSVTLSNAPLAQPRLNRRDVFFPIDRPVIVSPGDEVRVCMRVIPAETIVRWTVDVHGYTFRHSTFNGMLVAREDLARMHPQSIPQLTPRGHARLSVLELCDGVTPLAEIEREVFRRHPDLFTSAADAGAFVAEVVTRYAR